MLFNSYAFIFLFFPITAAVFFWLGKYGTRAAAGWLALASLVFYGWWNVSALPLLLGSIVGNYLLSHRLVPVGSRSDSQRRRWLYVALAGNLALLGYYKYANFFIDNANHVFETLGFDRVGVLAVVLPVGISFFTFTQIAFLVDCWAGKVVERSFIHYVLFVTYFPHLVAGPVLHHAQMMPQFARRETYRLDAGKLVLGISTFVIGLSKKLLLADPIGQFADTIFGAVAQGTAPGLWMAWFGTFAYTFQIYFDFSGYSDMAVGLALMLGVHLPINFSSPYRATSIIEFWRRWHMTLSAFLRDYLYIPLGGNRAGPARRYVNLFITMVLGGLWHGANWTFVLWGAAHGGLLILNHAWRGWRGEFASASRIFNGCAWLLTFCAVCLTWVLFRSASLDDALTMYRGMAGINGAPWPAFEGLNLPYRQAEFGKLLLVALFICLALPPSHALSRFVPVVASWPRLRGWQVATTALFIVTLFGYCASRLGHHSPFLYFQF